MVRKRLYSFRVGDNSFIDVYILGPLGFSIWTPWCYRLCTCVTPKRFFKEYQDIDFLGVQCKCVKIQRKFLSSGMGKIGVLQFVVINFIMKFLLLIIGIVLKDILRV